VKTLRHNVNKNWGIEQLRIRVQPQHTMKGKHVPISYHDLKFKTQGTLTGNQYLQNPPQMEDLIGRIGHLTLSSQLKRLSKPPVLQRFLIQITH
jgi:hypothetical protein